MAAVLMGIIWIGSFFRSSADLSSLRFTTSFAGCNNNNNNMNKERAGGAAHYYSSATNPATDPSCEPLVSVRSAVVANASKVGHILVPRLVYLKKTHSSSMYTKIGREIRYPMTLWENVILAGSNSTTEPTYPEYAREWHSADCQPMENIMVRHTCNSLHELGALDGSALSSSKTTLLDMGGTWRSVWKTKDPISEENIILKVLYMTRDVDTKAMEAQELDVTVMERLTASPHIISAYGFCGQSVLTQLAPYSAASALDDPKLTWRDRLVMGRDLAIGLAELHSLQPSSKWWDRIFQQAKESSDTISFLQSLTHHTAPLFAHNDVKFHNAVSLQPRRVQWNDFNNGMVSKNHTDGSGPCQVPIRYGRSYWRSPEEIQTSHNGQLPSLQPSDVYSFGTSFLYTILTKEHPWGLMKAEKNLTALKEDMARKKLRGDWPIFPPRTTNDEQQEEEPVEAKILFAAIQACSRLDPKDRPTALRLAVTMAIALEWLDDDSSSPSPSPKTISARMVEIMFA